MTSPSFILPVIVGVYPDTASSSTVYTISFPAEYLSRSVNDHVQLFDLDAVVVFPVSAPSANSLIVTLSGLIPSWLFASSHVLLPLTLVFFGV